MTSGLPIPFGTGTIVGLVCGLGLVAFSLQGQQEASSFGPFVVYLEDGPFVTQQMTRNGTRYLPLADLIRRLGLPYTDATATETFTIRAPNGTLIATADDRTILIDGESLELAQPAFREEGRWFAPLEFVERGLGAITGTAFRGTGTAPRLIAGNVTATPLDMVATQTDGLTLLTIRAGDSVNVRVQQNPDGGQVTLAIDRAPMRPSLEVLDYSDMSIRAVKFDDSDGHSKIVVETTPQLANVRLVPMDENKTFLVEFITETVADLASGLDTAPESDSRASLERLRVIVIDPGHGGLDSGTSAYGRLEKDLTLALARRLRQALQARLDSTVVLTRDQDSALSGEIRSAIANGNQADLLISLHVGFSPDPTESGASLFVMQTLSSEFRASNPEETFFKPWYEAYWDQRESSRTFARMLQQELSTAIPGLEVPVREAPLSLLTSTTMPAVLVEMGNANNPDNLNSLADTTVQDRWIGALANAVARFDERNEVF